MIFSGIKFYNQNQNNTDIANAINSTLTPTDEIVQPGEVIQAGTVTVTQSSVTVTGSGTNFNLLAVGQLFFVFIGTVPSLIGEILTINSSTSITLKATGPSPVSGSGLQFAATNKLIRTNQSIYMMVPTIISGNGFTVPAVRNFRLFFGPPPLGNDSQNQDCDPSILSFSQASVVNFPNVPTNPQLVPLLIRKVTPVPGITNNVITSSQPVVNYGAPSNFPANYWFILDPLPNTDPNQESLLANTSFQVFTQGDFVPFVVQNNITFLSQALADTPNNSGGYY
jgi:hypothetical protein